MFDGCCWVLPWDRSRLQSITHHSTSLRYTIGNDPANWLAIHPENGIITARDHLDRESVFVKNNTYVAIVLASDDGNGCVAGKGGRRSAGWLWSLVGKRIKSLFVAQQ